MNYADVKARIENELFDTAKFEKLEGNAVQQSNYVKHEVKLLTIHLADQKLITEKDKTLIAELSPNNQPKLTPEYQPEAPYVYPLF